MTNREWLFSLSDEELAVRILYDHCRCCINHDSVGCKGGNCIGKDGVIEWLNKKHKEPMPTLKVGDIVQTKPYCRYVAIDSLVLVRAENKERVYLCDIGDIVQIYRSEGAEYKCIWMVANE
jgi:hypothetical protein